jgi:hypothetical protein
VLTIVVGENANKGKKIYNKVFRDAQHDNQMHFITFYSYFASLSRGIYAPIVVRSETTA